MDNAPATELDAINVILTNMGEAPLNSIVGDLPLDAYKAQATLVETSRDLQTTGWFWNTETSTFAPDINGVIPLPMNALAVKQAAYGPYLTVRAGKLYQIAKGASGGTFTSPQTVEVTYFLHYEDMPPAAQRYATLKAARVFQARELGNQLLYEKDTLEEQLSWATLVAEDNANSRRTLKSARDIFTITSRSVMVQ